MIGAFLPALLPAAPRWRGHLVTLAATALVTGVCWMSIVPPFEGPDEMFFYNRARAYAVRSERSEALFYRLVTPIVRRMSPDPGAVAPEYNPAFKFVSNARGEVNRFAHDRRVAPREHVRTLAAIRGVVVLLSAATVLIVYAIARLSLGDARQALLVAGISLWIPQYSFMNAVAHPEAVTRLVAAAATLIVVARATRAVSSATAWALAIACVAVVPFADRQAFFLVPFVAIGLVLTEATWTRRAAVALVLGAAGAAAWWAVTRFTELGTDFGPWQALLLHPLWPFSTNAAVGSTPPGAAYYAYEFVPKMFEGFWGWMGQPSILLPAWMYGTLAALTILAICGLVLRLRLESNGEERRRLTARRLMAVGIVLMCIPIVYGPAIAGRNLWYGRWLFAMLGPLTSGFVIGIAAFARAARRNPHRVALTLGAAAAIAWAVWLAPPGDAMRAALAVHHYGDDARLVAACRDTLIALACAAAIIEAVARVSVPVIQVDPAVACLVAAGAANAGVLIAFVRPLYVPPGPNDYVVLISRYLEEGDTPRAAAVYASAVKSFPDAPALSQLADASPRLLLGGDSPASRARLWAWIARGHRLDDRDALLMLSREAAAGAAAAWRDAGVVDAVIADAERTDDLAEPAALLRLAVHGGLSAADAGREPVAAGRGVKLATPVRNGEMVFEGFTVHPRGTRGTQVVVYIRPRVEAANHRLWLHAYPEGSPTYVDLEPTIPPVWTPGVLSWAVYVLPPGRFTVYLGLWAGNDLGTGTPMGTIP